MPSCFVLFSNGGTKGKRVKRVKTRKWWQFPFVNTHSQGTLKVNEISRLTVAIHLAASTLPPSLDQNSLQFQKTRTCTVTPASWPGLSHACWAHADPRLVLPSSLHYNNGKWEERDRKATLIFLSRKGFHQKGQGEIYSDLILLKF